MFCHGLKIAMIKIFWLLHLRQCIDPYGTPSSVMGHFEHYILMDGKLSKRSNRAETYCLYKGPSKISSMIARRARDILIGTARVMI